MDDNVKTPPDNKVAQSRHFKQILFACLCVLVMACLVFFVFPKRSLSPGLVRMQSQQIAISSPSPANLVNLPAGWTSYTDPDFHLSFGYPASWTLGGFQEGKGGFANASGTGFFRMGNDFFQEQVSLDDLVKNECNHLLQPCGTKPVIQTLTVAGQDARLIWPSSDSRGNPNAVYLYVSPPTHCGFIYIEAAKDYILQIIKTMKFQSLPSPEDMCSLPTQTSTPNENPALLHSPPPSPPPPAP